VRIVVADAAAAGTALAAAGPLVHGDAPADDRVDIELPGGILENATLQLGSVYDRRRLHVTVHGNGTTLRTGRLHLVGATITVADVRIEGAPDDAEPVRLHACDALTLDRVVITGLRAPRRGPGTLARAGVRLEALARPSPGPPTRATLSRLVVEDNTGPILRFSGQAHARFGDVAVIASRFARNDAPEVVLGPVDVFRVEATVRAGTGAFAVATSSRTLILSEPD
jgi:hypothetical protein